ncbi:putative MFS-type transporter C09D4.1 [Styela clava]|uniref:feline leukemia virus subgroup C receptor-related protein 1-like n=1 Tax=Styela clava TaxID=7725 RepID=UPI001939711B|nr:feline leukemia virus subgroup C receptor-related protein 1-like [Styela clava]
MEYKSYARRWLLLMILCIISFTQIYTTTGFAILHDVVANYFSITPYQADILTMVGQLIAFPVGIGTAYFADILSLQALMLGMLISLEIGSLMCAIGFSSRELFYVTAVGRIMMSSIMGVLRATQVVLAANWFLQNETATAFALPQFFMKLAGIAGSLIYPHTIPKVHITANGTEEYTSTTILFTATNGIFSTIVLIALIVGALYCKNYPPSPPSRSQEQLILSTTDSAKNMTNNRRLSAIWNVVNSKPFVLISAAFFFASVSLSYVVYLMPSFVLSSFPELDNTTPGYISISRTAVSALSAMATGKILDRYKAFKLTAFVGIAGVALSLLCLYYAHSYKLLSLIYTGYCVAAVGQSVLITANVELLVETTYPCDKLRMMSIYGGIAGLGVFLWTSAIRAVKEKFNVPSATILATAVATVSMLLILSVSPDYKRLKTDKTKSETLTDRLNENH